MNSWVSDITQQSDEPVTFRPLHTRLFLIIVIVIPIFFKKALHNESLHNDSNTFYYFICNKNVEDYIVFINLRKNTWKLFNWMNLLKEGTFVWSRWAWLCNIWVMWSARSLPEPLWSFVGISTPVLTQVTPHLKDWPQQHQSLLVFTLSSQERCSYGWC